MDTDRLECWEKLMNSRTRAYRVRPDNEAGLKKKYFVMVCT